MPDLLVRGRSGLRPTPELDAALGDLHRAFAALDRVTETLYFQRVTEIHIVAEPDWAELWLVPRLPSFRAKHPQILFCINGEGDVPVRLGAPDIRVEYATDGPGEELYVDRLLPVTGPDNLRRLGDSDAQEVLEVTGPGNGQPAWQPGQEAVLAVQDGRLVLVDLESGASRVITEGPSHSDPAWFPDGQRIVFSAPDDLGGRDLFVTDLEGTITPLGLSARIDSGGSPSVLNRPAVSPVDEAIAFHVNTAEGLDIWVQLPDGEVVLAAGEPGSSDFHPTFGASGELIWSSDRSGVERVYVRRPGTTEDIEVAMPPGASVMDADVSPCGDVLVVQLDDPADGGSRIAHRGLGPGSGPLEQVPVPEGVADATDPSWAGQSCPA